jgi:HAD superfamily hydrolase (TIGR01509 family)
MDSMRDQKSNPSGVIWDFDGTIVQGSEAVYNQVTASALFRLGLTEFAGGIPETVRNRLAGKDAAACWKYFCENHGLNASLEELMLARQESLEPAAQEALAAGTLRMRPHVEDSMRAIKDLRMRQVIATNGRHDELAIFMRIFGLTEDKLEELGIEHICYVTDVPRPKPAPDLYLLAARKLGLHPSECVAIEDSKTGAVAAACAGTLVIARAEHNESMFRSIRAMVRRNPDFWRTFFRQFRGHRGRLRQLFFRNQLFIISPEANPLAIIQQLRNEALLIENDLARPRQVALTTLAVVLGAMQAARNPENTRRRSRTSR